MDVVLPSKMQVYMTVQKKNFRPTKNTQNDNEDLYGSIISRSKSFVAKRSDMDQRTSKNLQQTSRDANEAVSVFKMNCKNLSPVKIGEVVIDRN